MPETSKLTLEEMDVVFGSSRVASADQERMAQINREIGLDRMIHGGMSPPSEPEKEANASVMHNAKA